MFGSRCSEGAELGRDEVLGRPGEEGGVGGAGMGVVFAGDVEGEGEEGVGLGV